MSTTHDDGPRSTDMASAHVPGVVFHYSEDGTISRFAPHVPQTNPSHPPAVWAMDEEHSPLYWFPRDCPRISVWATNEAQRAIMGDTFNTDAKRVCALESHWLEGMRRARVYRYTFDGAQFTPWAQADGQYISSEAVHPQSVEVLDDLMELHAAAEVELRFTPRLGALTDRMLASGLPFSFVRIRDALR